MKIKSYKKIKNNCYKISFYENENEMVLYDETILKFNLLLKKEITPSDLKEIIKENEKYICYYKAIKYLSGRNRCKKEIKEYLMKNKFDIDVITYVLTLLEERKYINESNFLKAYINDKVVLSSDGPKKIKRKLMDLGFSENEIILELNKIDKNIWDEKLSKIITKKVNTNKKDSLKKLKERIIYNCINDGFDREAIISILENIEIPKNNDALEKEVQKLYKKLSNKYKENELFFQIKGRLLQKGFLLGDIESIINDIKKLH